MNVPTPDLRTLRMGVALGALVAFLVTVAIALAVGASGWPVIAGGVFVGIFVGGGLGLLTASRVGHR